MRRGPKVNQVKNAGSARDFAAGKKIGRPKQRWVWDVKEEEKDIVTGETIIVAGYGHWKKVTRDGK